MIIFKRHKLWCVVLPVVLAFAALILSFWLRPSPELHEIATCAGSVSIMLCPTEEPDSLLVLSKPESLPGTAELRILSLSGTSEWLPIAPDRRVTAAAISPKGDCIAGVCDDTQLFLADRTGDVTDWTPRLPSPVQALAFSPDGRLAVSTESHFYVISTPGFMQEYCITRDTELRSLAVGLSREGILVEATATAEVLGGALHTESLRPRIHQSLPPAAYKAAFSPNAEYAAFLCYDGTVKAGRSSSPLSLKTVAPFSGLLWSSLAFSNRGGYLVIAGGRDHQVVLLEVESWRVYARSPRNPDRVYAVSMNEEQDIVYLATASGSLLAWQP